MGNGGPMPAIPTYDFKAVQVPDLSGMTIGERDAAIKGFTYRLTQLSKQGYGAIVIPAGQLILMATISGFHQLEIDQPRMTVPILGVRPARGQ